MDKQAAIDFIHQELSQNRSQADIIADLCQQLNAPTDKVGAFVAKVAADNKPNATTLQPTTIKGSYDNTTASVTLKSEKPLSNSMPNQTTAQTPSYPENPIHISSDFYKAIEEPAVNQEDLEDMILKLLRKDQRRSDVVMEVCEQTGMDWNQAQRLVAQISTKHNKHLVTRQNMFIIPLAALALLAGLGLIWASVSEGLEIARQMTESPSQIAYQTSEIEFILREGIWGFVIGISLFLGGTFGLIRALQTQLD